MKAVVLPVTGPARVEEVAGLKDLQRLVGGYIEALPFRRDVVAYIHEEGKLQAPPLPRNERATVMCRRLLARDDYIAGDLVLVGRDSSTGDDVDVPEDIREWLEQS